MSGAGSWRVPETTHARPSVDLIVDARICTSVSASDVHDAPAQTRCQHLQVVGSGELDAQNAGDQVVHGTALVVSSHLEDRDGRDVRGELSHQHAFRARLPPSELVTQHRLTLGHPRVCEQTGDPAADERPVGVVLPFVEPLPEVAHVDLHSCDVAVNRVQDATDHAQVALQRREQLAELAGLLVEHLPVLGRALDLDVRDLALRGELVGVVPAGGPHEGGDQRDAFVGVHGGQRRREQLAEPLTEDVRQLVVEATVQVGLVPVVRVDDARSVVPVRAQQRLVDSGVLPDVLADLADDGEPDHLGPQAESQMGGVGLVGALHEQAGRGSGLSAEGCRGQGAVAVRADVRDARELAVADLPYRMRAEHTGQEGVVGAFGGVAGSLLVVGNTYDVRHEVSWKLKVHCGVAAAVNPGG